MCPAFVHRRARKRGGTLTSSIFRGRDFVTWVMVTVQSILQVWLRIRSVFFLKLGLLFAAF